MATGHRLFCKQFLCFNTMSCRHMPLLVHLLLMYQVRSDHNSSYRVIAHVTWHTSHATCKMPHVTCHMYCTVIWFDVMWCDAMWYLCSNALTQRCSNVRIYSTDALVYRCLAYSEQCLNTTCTAHVRHYPYTHMCEREREGEMHTSICSGHFMRATTEVPMI